MEETNLEKAERLYRGKKAICLIDLKVFELNGKFKENSDGRIWHCFDQERCLIFSVNKWAEIVTEQKEENDKTYQERTKNDAFDSLVYAIDVATKQKETPSVEVGKCYTVNYYGNDAIIIVSKIDGLEIWSENCINTKFESIEFNEGFWKSDSTGITINETPERLPWLNYCIENNKYISEEEFNKLSKVETVEYVNGEEVECKIDGEDGYSIANYIGKDGENHVVWHWDCYLNIEPENIRNPQSVNLPDIGSLCLFSSNKEDHNEGHGEVSNLFMIDSKGLFIDSNNIVHPFCKQIESIKFK